MRLKKLRLRNFRAYDRIIIDFEKDITVFAGENGVGKSTILEATSKLLSQILPTITDSNSRRRYFGERDIKYNKSWYFADLEIGDDRGHIVSRRNLINKNVSALADYKGYTNFKTKMIAVYYSVNRSLLIQPRKIPAVNEKQAFSGALLGKPIELKYFISWYRVQRELGLDRKSLINAVKKAVYSFLPGFNNLKILVNPKPTIVLKKSGDVLDVSQMSDGEKSVLAMVIDLSRRLALANPDSLNPTIEGKAIVLIDEIELHLHPDWQRSIIHKFKDTFPNCQFVFTTHSPQVLGEVPARCIRCLYRDEDSHKIKCFTPQYSIGLDSSEILEELMDVSRSNAEIKLQADKIYELIELKKFEEAKVKINELATLYGRIHELVRLETALTFSEVENESANEED